jgi:SlyX protein
VGKIREERAEGAMDRVEALEERVAHLMRAVEELSDVVARQAGEIAGLERRVRLLMERAAEEEGLGGAPPEANVRPPHW